MTALEKLNYLFLLGVKFRGGGGLVIKLTYLHLTPAKTRDHKLPSVTCGHVLQ